MNRPLVAVGYMANKIHPKKAVSHLG